MPENKMIKVLRYAFVACDGFVGLVLFFGSMNAIMGVHIGVTLGHVLLGVAVLSFAVGMFVAGYAVAKDLRWQRRLRLALYVVLVVVFFAVSIHNWRYPSPKIGSFDAYAFLFSLANLVGYVLWLRYKQNVKQGL